MNVSITVKAHIYDNVLKNSPKYVYDDLYSMCEGHGRYMHIDIISVLKGMIDVRYGFKTYSYFTTDQVEDVINSMCLN